MPAPRRPRILTLVSHFTPAYKSGGPVKSIENLVTALGGEFEFRIVTLDRDLGDIAPFPSVPIHSWTTQAGADVYYQDPGLSGLLRLLPILRRVDAQTVLYLNSLFARRFSILPLFLVWLGICRPRCVVIAPRGELHPGPLVVRKGRKALYLAVARTLGMYRSVVWHASNDEEAMQVAGAFPEVLPLRPSHEAAPDAAPDAVLTPPAGFVVAASDIGSRPAERTHKRTDKRAGELRIVFLSRISPKKNLAQALRILAEVSGAIEFDVFGPIEDRRYWAECQAIANRLPPNIRFQYCGELKPTGVPAKFAEHDLFLFPTLGENFGHVVCEALLAGCPVLISDRTPWRDLESEGAGWDLPLDDPDRFRAAIQFCVDAGPEWRARAADNAIRYARSRVDDSAVIEANRFLFHLAANCSPRRR